MGIVFPSFESERFDISQLNVNCSWDFSDQVLTVDTTNEMPTLICRCLQALAEALKINGSVTNIILHTQQPDWRRGRQGLVCGGLRRIAECCGMS